VRVVLFTLLSTLPLLCFGCSSSDNKGTNTPLKTTGNSNTTDAGDTTESSGPEPKLPAMPATCPQLQTGTINIMGDSVKLWVGEKQTDKKGPILLYWHGTGSNADEISRTMAPMVAEVQAAGGIAASWDTSAMQATTNTGNNVWFTGDYDVADVIVACAVQQLNIDTHRIFAAGCSAGGLQAGSMVYARASYLAAAMPNSGGDVLITTADDDSHVPSVITAHGSYAQDFFILHFSDWSKALDQAVANKGGLAVDCDHGGGHCGAPQDLIAAQWQFVKDHPFGITKDPYANGLPSTFPSYCKKVSPADAAAAMPPAMP
jgi:predicted esterase